MKTPMLTTKHCLGELNLLGSETHFLLMFAAEIKVIFEHFKANDSS